MAAADDVVVIPWESREELRELRGHGAADSIVGAFRDVGVSRPVELTRELNALLYEPLNWSRRVTVDELPVGVGALRCAIAHDLYHDPA